jgi:hypothetical protein
MGNRIVATDGGIIPTWGGDAVIHAWGLATRTDRRSRAFERVNRQLLLLECGVTA